jgi:putative ABC transport system permease protein
MRSALAALGITIGIASVVWVVSLGRAGAERAQAAFDSLGDNFVWIEAGGRNVNGVRTGDHGTTSLTIEDAEAIRRDVPTIKAVSPNADGAITVVFGDHNWVTKYRGVSPEFLDIKRWPVVEGAPFTDVQVENAASVCLIGQTAARQIFGDLDPVGQTIKVTNTWPVQVVGVLSLKGQSATGQDQDDVILFPYTTAQQKIRGKGIPYLDDILCSAVSQDQVETAIEQVTLLLRDRHHIGPGEPDDFNIRRPDEIAKAQIDTSNRLSILLIVAASVSLLVGGISIMNVMLASVAERTQEIGVRLAVGATEGAVQIQFLGEAVLLSLFGGGLGLALGAGGTALIGGFLGWPMSIAPDAVAVAVGFAVAIGVFFGFYPARRAAQLDPIVALRQE